VSKQRGGLGRGLGALIPAATSISDIGTTVDPQAEPHPPIRGTGALTESIGGGEAGLEPPVNGQSNGLKIMNRVPSIAAMAASRATDIYFDPVPVPGATLRELRPDQISTNPRQPRSVFDEETLNELAHSIQAFGVLQPVVVRPKRDGYELVMGERRLRAAVIAGLATIPAIVRDTADTAMLRDALLENIHRAQLNPLEEAAAYQQLLEEFGTTHDELASRIGRSRSQVTNTIRLMNLPVGVQRRVAAGILSAGHARALLGLTSRDQQEELAGRIVAEGLSVRATEELVALAANGNADSHAPQRRRTSPRSTSPALGELADRLSDTLDTRVRVDLGRHKGRITVEFGSLDDLHRIVAVIAPSVPAAVDSSTGNAPPAD